MGAWDDMRALLPDNSTGEISAQDLRNVVTLLEGEDADNTKGGQDVNIFLKTSSAVDLADTITAITDATSSKRYLITLGPGVHTTKPVTMKPFIWIIGAGASATVLNGTSVNDTMFTMAASTGIEKVNIRGLSGGLGMKMVSAGFCYARDVIFSNCLKGISLNNVGGAMDCSDVALDGSGISIGIECLAGNITVTRGAVSSPVTTITDAFIAVDGVNSIATLNLCSSFSSNVDKGYKFTGACQAVCSGASIVGAAAGFYITGDTRLVVKGSNIFNCASGVYIPEVVGEPDCEFTACTVLSNSKDFDVDHLTAKIRLMAVTNDFNSTQKSNNLIGVTVDETPGEKGVQVFGELKVGTPKAPRESVFGEGDSYAGAGRILVQTWSGAVWEDVTDDASDPDSGTVTFPNGNVDTAIYMASLIPDNGAFVKHGGMKINVEEATDGAPDLIVSGAITPNTTGNYEWHKNLNGQPCFKHEVSDFWVGFVQGDWCIFTAEPDSSTKRNTAQHRGDKLNGNYLPFLGTGTATVAMPSNPFPYVVEFYNGVSWEEVNFMMTDSSNGFISHGRQLFQHRGSFQVRYDALLDSDKDWEPSDPMSFGETLYWIRIRIASAITTSPVINQIKLHSNRTEINADGYMEFFGKGRPYNRLPWDMGLVQAFGSSPTNQDLFVGDTLGRGYIENAFGNGEYVGFNTFLPNQVDTSTPIRFAWAIMAEAIHADVTWTVRWGYTRDGDSVFTSAAGSPATGPNEKSVTVTAPVAAANTQYTLSVDLDIADMLPAQEGGSGDLLWITLERTSGGGGTDIQVINIQPLYLAYVLGGHI